MSRITWFIQTIRKYNDDACHYEITSDINVKKAVY